MYEEEELLLFDAGPVAGLEALKLENRDFFTDDAVRLSEPKLVDRRGVTLFIGAKLLLAPVVSAVGKGANSSLAKDEMEGRSGRSMSDEEGKLLLADDAVAAAATVREEGLWGRESSC